MDDGHAFPKAVAILENSLYVDDTLFGDDDIDGLQEARNQLIELMKRGGFQLRKWAANSSELLKDIPVSQHELIDHFLTKDDTLKVLGLSWMPKEDSFRFVICSATPPSPTKRTILLFVAKLYDPLGWAAPIVVTAKLLLQELWLLKGDWDDPVPPDLNQRWVDYYSGLKRLSNVRIPRLTGRHKENLGVEVHGFADASNCAYAAVVYLRVLHSLDSFQVSLLAAKTKVAPLKTVSIPRLELNAVVLLCRLLKWTLSSLNLFQVPLYGWTDSTITLAWLKQHPSKWSTYVANRVSEVQTSLPVIRWNHISSQTNPADCASRGLSATALVDHNLWWSGPPWLQKASVSWPIHDTVPTLDSIQTLQMVGETRKSTVLHVDCASEWDLPYAYSSWTKLVRVTAYVRRFAENLRRKKVSQPPILSFLNVDELRDAATFWFRSIQSAHFSEEWKASQKGSPVSSSSSLRSLNPFCGEDKLLRLGGRLRNAAIGYSERHPIIIPKHYIAELLVDQAHKATLHGGIQLTLRTLRQRYWILGARSVVKARIRQCVICARHAAVSPTQLMGDLPTPRVTQSPPFSHTDVNYTGPFGITSYIGRGQKTTKHYVALFICLSTKAIHLEGVDDYSTAGFLAAFQRFASRRGLPSHMYSDNGTNFHGADRELQESFARLRSDTSVLAQLANDSVNWHFISAAAPHFGGLWEAGVRSFKHHFRRIVGSRPLSWAEFATLLCKIEACLNSRPITALSDDPSDLSSLTSGHFLIGRPITAVPEESAIDIDPNRLSRWQLVRAMHEQICRSWTKDYLHSLQIRHKWPKPQPPIQVNELILMKNSLLPPFKWACPRARDASRCRQPRASGHTSHHSR